MNLVWFRRDLRVNDNPALFEACRAKQGVVALHINTPVTWQRHNMSVVQQEWLQQHLVCLQQQLNQLGIELVQQKTDYFSNCPDLILKIIKQKNIKAVYFNYQYEWDERRRDQRLVDKLTSNHIQVYGYHDQCLIPPDAVFNKQGQPYSVFTPYKKACLQHLAFTPQLALPLNRPAKQNNVQGINETASLLHSNFSIKAGSEAGHRILRQFIAEKIASYKANRDYPELDATSNLSAYLALGIISVRECIEALFKHFEVYEIGQLLSNEGVATWISELLWRDFYKMICFHYPHVSRGQPFQLKTKKLKWHDNPEHLLAWQQGQTGVPIIDAAMRQLNETGWMHNRLRMIAAMYLSKNLWLDWREGESYFASKLIDWDFAANNGGWQWSASTGTDAAPYFRIFNPVSQSQRFDPKGVFIRKYCPELAAIDDNSIHDPYQKNQRYLDYAKPLVDLKQTRAYAIDAFKKL